jgi:3-oxoacyl-[acyl-carrier protein] reductase
MQETMDHGETGTRPVRRVLVAGGSSGIGLAVVRHLRQCGDEVRVLARSRRELAEGEADFQEWDATSGTAPANLPERLDALLYFPGTIRLKPFGRLADEEFLEDFRVHCLGAVTLIRAALPALKAAGDASVLLVSTVAVAQGMPFHASIAAAKGAVEGLTRSLAAELAPAIRVNAIAPSLTDTPLAAGLLNQESKRQAAENRHPLRRIGRADDIARLACFLVSDKARFMTGQIVRPDGGLSAVRTF